MGAYSSYLAGLEYRPAAARKLLARAQRNDLLVPVREPDNQFDENAVALHLDREHVGYVPARHAVWFARHMDGGGFAAAYIVEVETKGWFGKEAEHADILLVTTMNDAPEGTEAARAADEEASLRYAQAEEFRRVENAIASLRPLATEVTALLRWVGRVADGPAEEKEQVIDRFIYELLAETNLDPTVAIASRLKRAAGSLKGSERRAMQAIEFIASERDHIPQISKSVMEMVRIDGAISNEETEIVRKYIETVRGRIKNP